MSRYVNGTDMQWQTVDGSSSIVLRFDEVGQHVVVAPALVAQFVPMVKVLSVASHVDHVVEDASPTQNFTAWPTGSLRSIKSIDSLSQHMLILMCSQ